MADLENESTYSLDKASPVIENNTVDSAPSGMDALSNQMIGDAPPANAESLAEIGVSARCHRNRRKSYGGARRNHVEDDRPNPRRQKGKRVEKMENRKLTVENAKLKAAIVRLTEISYISLVSVNVYFFYSQTNRIRF